MKRQPGYFYTEYTVNTKRYSIWAVGPLVAERISRFYRSRDALDAHVERLRANGWRWAAEKEND